MSSPSEESTQPFSDPAKVQRVINNMNTDIVPHALARQPSILPGNANAITPANFEITKLTEAFANATLTSVPDARLVLAHSSWPEAMDPAVIRLPQSVGGWDMIGVVQRTHDVRFTFNLPFYNPPCDPPNRRLMPLYLCCNIYYNPANDGCFLENKSIISIYLRSLDLKSKVRLKSKEGGMIKPGLWRISVEDDGLVKQHLLDFLVLRRQFNTTIHETPVITTVSAKRKIYDDHTVAAKRQRREGDMTEILLAPATKPLQNVSGVTTLAPTASSRRITSTNGTALLELKDGDTIVIQTTQPRSTSSPSCRGGGPPASGLASYTLNRLEHIARTTSASVFAVQHSAFSDNIVAKVMRYMGETVEDLINCARAWEREKRFLEMLSHVGVPISFSFF